MLRYRKTVGWAVRVLVAPVLVLWLASLFASRLLAEVTEAALRFVVEFAAAVEQWEVSKPDPGWRAAVPVPRDEDLDKEE